MPLFEVRALPWAVPAERRFDALLLTSAQAVRLAGPGVGTLASLPAIAVGEATGATARAAGLDVRIVGASDAVAAVSAARAAGLGRLLHLAGRERGPAMAGVTAIPVYAAEEVDLAPGSFELAEAGVALLHSPRAARRFADLADQDRVDRGTVRLAALSPAVLAAAGTGWAKALAADRPDDTALCRSAAILARD